MAQKDGLAYYNTKGTSPKRVYDYNMKIILKEETRSSNRKTSVLDKILSGIDKLNAKTLNKKG